jgi:hypothetical protein
MPRASARPRRRPGSGARAGRPLPIATGEGIVPQPKPPREQQHEQLTRDLEIDPAKYCPRRTSVGALAECSPDQILLLYRQVRPDQLHGLSLERLHDGVNRGIGTQQHHR